MHTVTVLTVLAVVSAVSAQYQQPGNNYVDDYSYNQHRPSHATPRSYPADSAPGSQQAAQNPKPTPVAILKQINKHNEDGSYTYGFEGADGSFKIETKLPSGDVRGKYGFVDDTGKVRVVEYGANQYGFQPAGEGITVAPPTLVDETTSKEALAAEYQQQRQGPVAGPLPKPPIQYPTAFQPPQRQTQAVYSPPVALPKPPIFTPAAQKQLLRQGNPFNEPAPPSQIYNQGPAQFSPAPGQQERHSQPQPRSQSGGLLDQLARDYALPQGSAQPLHDISFGYY